MGRKRREYSIKMLVMALTGCCLLLFALIFVQVYWHSHHEMPDRLEKQYLLEELQAVRGLFGAAAQETLREARVLSADGQLAGGDSALLRADRHTLLLVKGWDGNDLYTAGYDRDRDQPQPFAAGLAGRLLPLHQAVVATYMDDGPDSRMEAEKSAIVFYGDEAYFVVAVPVMGEAGGPAGTVMLGELLDNDYFHRLTSFGNAEFSVLPLPPGDQPGMDIAFPDKGTAVLELPLTDAAGEEAALLQIHRQRTVHRDTISTPAKAFSLFITTVLLPILVLYWVIKRLVIGPLIRLAKEVEAIDATGMIDIPRLRGGTELRALAQSINRMVEHMNQANISLEVMRNVLNATDLLIYVTDPDTDELLFLNDRMHEHYCVGHHPVGEVCWASFYSNRELYEERTGRCPYCAVEHLKQHPDEVIVTEGKSKMTDRWYRNTNRMIRWKDGRLVHMHYRMDINELKETQASTQRRVEQQELMSNISQRLLASDEIGEMITDVLRMTGEFMQTDCIMVAKADPEEDALEFIYHWFRGPMAPQGETLRARFGQGQPFYEQFVARAKPYIAHSDVAQSHAFGHLAQFGVKSMVAVPLHIGEEFWGMLYVAHTAGIRTWSRSDIHLIRLLGSIISGALARSQTEEQLVMMSLLVNSSPDYVTYSDGEGRFEYINPGASAMTGYNACEIQEGGLPLLFHEEDVRRIREEIIPQVAQVGSCTFQMPIIRKDGQERTLNFSTFALEYHGFGMGAIASDVTEKLRLEQELIDAKELAEDSSRAKSDFLSRMSHEIRTPMNAIIGMTGIGRSSGDLLKKDYCLERIDEASHHLLGVINDILDMSKIEANKFELSVSEFDLEKMLLRLANVMSVKIDEKRQDLLVDLDERLPQYIVGDEQRLAQVIANLLSNAVKFTPDNGTVFLSAKMQERGEDGACILQVTVKDNGIGITDEQKSRLFQSFEQADGGISRKFGGTGLGLAISKNIVELMGGSVWVESTPGEGSVFGFTVPVERGTEPADCVDTGWAWRDLRVLVVDDSADVRRYFERFFGERGAACKTVAGGKEAMAALDSTGRYSLALVDWMIPGTDSAALIGQLRARLGQSPVIAMASLSDWNDLEKEVGPSGEAYFLQKPIFSTMIVERIRSCFGQGPTGHELPDQEEEPEVHFDGRRILLAEDVEINREIILTMLEETGIAIDCAENGVEACAVFAARPDDYDLIFMDMHMPEMDGLEATRRIRAMPFARASEIPIIAMTANVFREDVEHCLQAGMNGHLGKPIDMDEIIRALVRYLPANG